MKNKFYIKSYADKLFYCYIMQWTIKIIRIFGFKIMWIHKIGYSIEVFPDIKQAKEFVNAHKREYINAKRYIKL